ncbi:MAG: septal ring lytic transglycosylase RlpA family protein [Pseudomonadota bacterium]
MINAAHRSLVTLVALVGVALAGCSGGTIGALEPALTLASTSDDKPDPKVKGRRMIGKPYKVGGRWYHPKEDEDYDETGMASWYGPKFHGRKTANGERFNQNAMTAAHPTLPLPSYVRVTKKSTGKSIVLRVNDRGPFRRGRIIDVSRAAAKELGLIKKGHAKVRVEYLGPAPVGGTDKETLVAARSFNKSKPQRDKPSEGRSLKRFLPFGLGKQDEDDGDAESVEVRLASAQTEPATRETKPLPGVSRAYQQRVRTSEEIEARRKRREESQTTATAFAAPERKTGAIDAVIAMNEAAEEKPIEAQPLPESAKAVEAERVFGAHDMFDNGSGVSRIKQFPQNQQ